MILGSRDFEQWWARRMEGGRTISLEWDGCKVGPFGLGKSGRRIG